MAFTFQNALFYLIYIYIQRQNNTFFNIKIS